MKEILDLKCCRCNSPNVYFVDSEDKNGNIIDRSCICEDCGLITDRCRVRWRECRIQKKN